MSSSLVRVGFLSLGDSTSEFLQMTLATQSSTIIRDDLGCALLAGLTHDYLDGAL